MMKIKYSKWLNNKINLAMPIVCIQDSMFRFFLRLVCSIHGRMKGIYFNWYWKKFESELLNNYKLKLLEIKYRKKQTGYVKYFEFRRTVEFNLKRALMLNLDSRLVHQNILDLGCGFGVFGLICRYFGHNYTGLDCDIPRVTHSTLFQETFRAINPNTTRISHYIERFRPMPVKDASFDMIVAFQIVFNRFNCVDPWGVDEWKYFLRELRRITKENASILLHFSKPNNSPHHRVPEVQELFLSLGLQADGPYVGIRREQLSGL
jgi:SAM-dependent methyltransferase